MLTDMTLGQYYPGHSYLHQMDPRAKILCTMIFIVAIFLAVPYLKERSRSSFTRAAKNGGKQNA